MKQNTIRDRLMQLAPNRKTIRVAGTLLLGWFFIVLILTAVGLSVKHYLTGYESWPFSLKFGYHFQDSISEVMNPVVVMSTPLVFLFALDCRLRRRVWETIVGSAVVITPMAFVYGAVSFAVGGARAPIRYEQRGMGYIAYIVDGALKTAERHLTGEFFEMGIFLIVPFLAAIYVVSLVDKRRGKGTER